MGLERLLLMPGEGEMDGGGGGMTAPEPAPAPGPALDSTAGLDPAALAERPSMDGEGALPAAQSTPGDPNAAAAAAPAGTSPTIREAARHYGLDLSQFEDDGQAFAALVQMAQRSREGDFYANLGRQIAPHAEQVQQYLAEQQAHRQAPEERQPWEAPEFDERWLQLVEKDPSTGQYVAKPGVNPAVAERVQAYADHIDQWTGQLARNPAEALRPMIRAFAEELLTERFGQVQATQEAQGIIEANAPWIYATDAQGRRQVGQDGKFVPTPLGARYYSHLVQLRQNGVTDARALDALAKQLLQGEMYANQAAQAAGGQQAAGPQSRAALGHAAVNPGQAVPPTRRPYVPAATDPNQEGMSLSDRLRAAMVAEGVTDADFQLTA